MDSNQFFAKAKAVIFHDRERTYARVRKSRVIRIVVAIIYRDGKILVTRRKAGAHFGGLFEFPGGKIMSGEHERSALKREMMEELGVEVAVRPAFLKTRYHHHGRVTGPFEVSFHRCQILSGEPRPLEGQEMFWFTPAEILQHPFPPANRDVLQKIPKMRW